MCNPCIFAILCGVTHIALGSPLKQLPQSDPSGDSIRPLLRGAEFEQFNTLVAMGEKVFPAFETILADEKTDPLSIARILTVLRSMEGDRKRFVEPSVVRLADRKPTVRWSAVMLLAQIGGPSDIAPIVALLADDDPTVVFQAAVALKSIGNYRTVSAMDVWLNSGNRRDVKQLIQHVAKCRDELKQRLDKEKEKAKKPKS